MPSALEHEILSGYRPQWTNWYFYNNSSQCKLQFAQFVFRFCFFHFISGNCSTKLSIETWLRVSRRRHLLAVLTSISCFARKFNSFSDSQLIAVCHLLIMESTTPTKWINFMELQLINGQIELNCFPSFGFCPLLVRKSIYIHKFINWRTLWHRRIVWRQKLHSPKWKKKKKTHKIAIVFKFGRRIRRERWIINEQKMKTVRTRANQRAIMMNLKVFWETRACISRLQSHRVKSNERAKKPKMDGKDEKNMSNRQRRVLMRTAKMWRCAHSISFCWLPLMPPNLTLHQPFNN